MKFYFMPCNIYRNHNLKNKAISLEELTSIFCDRLMDHEDPSSNWNVGAHYISKFFQLKEMTFITLYHLLLPGSSGKKVWVAVAVAAS